MYPSFPGFPQDLFDFLIELRANNNRDWFQANKPRYRESIVTPVCAFIEAMAPRLLAISDSYIADPRSNGGSMFRIYRDARFSKDKRPYKENVGCQFRHTAGKDAHAPGFYLHLAPQECFIACGVWQPPNPVLHQIRTVIVEKPKVWGAVTNSKNLIKRFGGIQGDGLKRPPRGYSADHPAIEDLKRKSFLLVQDIDPQVTKLPTFIDQVAAAYRDGSPLMQFVTSAMGLSYSSVY